ncbi:MAG TPA: OmpA family protein [Gammaproteobacteria bacterium]
MLKPLLLTLTLGSFPALAATSSEEGAPIRESEPLGETVEMQLPPDIPLSSWGQDESAYPASKGDRIETQQVIEQQVKTIKLHNVVPPIRYGSGDSEIPESYIGMLRDILNGMKDRRNVRLHFVGHSDNVQLRGPLKERFGDNTGLSRERAGTAAEFFQRALDLPPESISYEGLGENHPVASNASAAGKAQNRRVEVEVWYDEVEDKQVEKQVVIEEKINRVKVCRVETVCKLSYKEGHSKRARIKNLVPPLHFNEESAEVPQEFRNHVLQALNNLGDKQNVVVKLIGYTDDTPLFGRDERIYGNHQGLSKARARRAALALQDALKLPTTMLDSDGRGNTNPIASNETEQGRALNRRIEVEFWYDDIMAELPDEPQLCPEAAAAETVTRVYEPPSGAIKPIYYENGKPAIADGYVERLRMILADVKAKSNVRLRFIGYTNNERLDRRTAMVYGDDVGLSSARARRVMEIIKPRLELSDKQTEFEGRGYVQTDDVVNSGFIEAEVSRVEVQVVYDELAMMDELDAMDITRMTREVTTSNPYALNLMRITVDGRPIDDPNKSIPDVQRCTDVALEKADVQFKFDNLELKPRLNVTAWPNAVRYQDDEATANQDNQVQFRIYSNYPAFFERAEIRLFDSAASLRDTPIDVIPVAANGRAEWLAQFREYHAPGRELKYLLRVYDKAGNYDETAAQSLWILDKLDEKLAEHDVEKELLVGYGENRLITKNIPLNGGVIKVYGSRIPTGRHVWVAGRPVPVADNGEFAVEEILPAGLHTVEVSVLDNEGNGELFLRDLELQKSDWFYVAMADVTASKSRTNGPAELVTNESGHYDDNLAVDGQMAFYTQGKFGNNWQLTASADTLEGPVEDLFSNFMEKSPDAMFRRIDPDYYYPTYGDDSTVEEGAPTLGKFYLKLRQNDNYGMWGNFKVAYTDNNLAHVDRNLYGANIHYQNDGVTSFGEKRFMVDGFAAQPGTVAGRDEFRGTGGSLYYLRHQDILTGSERVRIEVRDKVSGMVMAVKNLTPALDYDIDYLQGRVMLSEPLSPSSADGLLVSSEASGGNEVYLVARYEYSTGFDDVNNLSRGGRSHLWMTDYLKLGVTTNRSDEPGNESSLTGGDLTLRKSAQTWLKVEKSNSEGLNSTSFLSNDGGFNFGSTTTTTLVGDERVKAGASRVDTSIGFNEIHESANGNLTFYRQSVEAGYSAPGLNTLRDTEQQGGTVKFPLTETIGVRAKTDKKEQAAGLNTSASELDADYQLNDNWQLSTGVRQDTRKDNSPLIPLTQIEGERTDLVLRAAYDSKGRWSSYGYVQDTVDTTGNQEENGRIGAGGAYRVTDRFKTSGELSGGDMGAGAKLGTEYLYSDRTNLYMNYALENGRTDNGVRAQRGNMSTGVKSRYSDTTSVYLEEKYTHGDVPTGLTHATGVDLAPNDRWNFGASLDFGTLRDNQTSAKMERKAVGVKMGYAFEAVKLASALEYRVDDIQSPDLSTSERTTWLTKNSLKYQFTPDWRFIGKVNYSNSKSSLGEFYDGKYTEAVAGYGYRPVANDRLNMLMKYTYFYNLPSAGQVTIANTAAEYIQKSHIVSVDSLYDLTPRWSVGGKYAYRHGQVSMDRVNPEFFASRASLYILRADWHVVRHWEALIEGRLLELPDAQDRRSGALLGIYRHLGDNVKLGAGYNFTSFSDDLTDLTYDNHGIFINLVGKI